MTGLKRSNIRMVHGITISIVEDSGDGKENKDVMGCGRCAVDRGMSRAGIRTRAADRCGGILIPPGGI